MKVLVTGAAGFIGFHTAKQLLERGDTVVGLDNFNDYYQDDIADPTTDYTWGPLRGRYIYGGLSFSMAR